MVPDAPNLGIQKQVHLCGGVRPAVADCQRWISSRRYWLTAKSFNLYGRQSCLESLPRAEAFNFLQSVSITNGETMKSIIVSMVAAAGLMVAGSAMATDMPAVAKKNNCTACHAVDKKVVGPAWKDVAAKTDKSDAALAEKIKKGGSGSWGAMPMPANPKVSDADMKEIIAFIRSLK